MASSYMVKGDTVHEPGLALGIDVGGTKTRWMVSQNGRLIADRQVPTLVWRRGNYSSEDCFALGQLVVADLGNSTPMRTVIGANGCSDELAVARCEMMMRKATGWNVCVVNDAELLSHAGGGRGISLVAGTGSIAVARDPRGRLISAGGWGWLLGDDGGGAGLVRDALREALAADDMSDTGSKLSAALRIALDVPSLLQANAMLAQAPSAARLAQHASTVFEVAASGCVIAQRVIQGGASSLAGLVDRLLRRGASGPVFAGGGIFETQPQFLDQVSHFIRRRHDVITLLVQDPPVLGALRLAERGSCKFSGEATDRVTQASLV